MASSNTEGPEAGDRTEVIAGPVELERTITCPEGGVVATFVLSTAADERTWVRLEQPLPSDFAIGDVGFRTDAAPADWSVEDGLVYVTGEVPADGTVEYVLGLKLPDESTPDPLLLEPELARCDEPEGPDRAAAKAQLEWEGAALEEENAGDDGTAARSHGATATDGGTDSDGGAAGNQDATEDDTADGPAVIGNPDGELAASIRKVVDDEPAEGTEPSGSDATEASGTPAATPDGDGLEAAVTAVEPELDDGADAGTSETTESTEIDLEMPDQEEGSSAPHPPEGDTSGSEEEPADLDTTPTLGTDVAASSLDVEGAQEVARGEVESLVDCVEQADEGERGRLREALGLDGAEGSDATATGAGPHDSGALDVRLQNVESRLSAFEAYEEALESFIEDSGTAEEISEQATEAAEATSELREELAGLRADIQCAREERDSLQDVVQAATEERDALREEVAALREEVDEVRGLRQQLLGALQTPGGAETTTAAANGDD